MRSRRGDPPDENESPRNPRHRNVYPVLAVDANPSGNDADRQRYLLRRCGYACDGLPNIVLTRLAGDDTRATCDPYQWPDNPRTFRVAYLCILEHWAELRDGDVVDVEWILGLTAAPKVSERSTEPLEEGAHD